MMLDARTTDIAVPQDCSPALVDLAAAASYRLAVFAQIRDVNTPPLARRDGAA